MKNKTDFRVSVIGLGYIGLPTAAMFASRQIEVVGVDINHSVVEKINRGEIHIVEPYLEDIVKQTVTRGFLKATTKPEPADAFLIAVPTPFKKDTKEPDLSYIQSAACSIATVLQPGNLVILESTSPVGTTEKLECWLSAARPDLNFPGDKGEESDIRIAYCPERVLPGQVLHELIRNDRIIGGMTAKCSQEAAKLYDTFVEAECLIANNPRMAEMVKLTENSFRDVNIAFANEISMICDELEIDVWQLIKLANRHPRVNILQPGPGVGGHCIACDPWFIVASNPNTAKLIQAARNVNDTKPAWVEAKIMSALAEFQEQTPQKSGFRPKIACYGITFKPNIDDIRDSPALKIARTLCEAEVGHVLIVEPHLKELPESLKKAKLVEFSEAATSDIHVLLVDHDCFMNEARPDGKIVDARGLWQK